MVIIDETICRGCGICYEICPDYVIQLKTYVGGKEASVRYPDQCSSCGHCISHCPSKAIRFIDEGLNRFEKLKENNIDMDDLSNLLYSRRSVRKYKDQPVSGNDINRLFDVAMHAGTGSNLQTTDFTVLHDKSLIEKIELTTIDILWNAGFKYFSHNRYVQKIFTALLGPEITHQCTTYHDIISNRRNNNELKGMIFRNAPMVIIAHDLAHNPLGAINCALALRNMELQAITMGMGTCWTGLFMTAASRKPGLFHRLLDVDESRKIYGGLMIGYPKYVSNYKIPRKQKHIKC